MRLLLDTHVLMWWFEAPERISRETIRLIDDEATDVFVSAVIPWEIAIKRAIGKLRAAAGNVPEFIALGGIPLPITLEHAAAVEHLPLHHGDPFDRLLLAQATVEGASIVSGDPAFAPYDVPIVW